MKQNIYIIGLTVALVINIFRLFCLDNVVSLHGNYCYTF